MKSKSKIDWWVSIVLWGSILLFIPLFFLIQEEGSLILWASFGFMVILVVPFVLNTYYRLDENHLHIQAGFFRQRIPYENIKHLTLTTNWLSSMALSSKRIEIKEHDKGFIMGTTYISPINREEFYDSLYRLCPNLEEKNTEQ